jgi:hypothetical protein
MTNFSKRSANDLSLLIGRLLTALFAVALLSLAGLFSAAPAFAQTPTTTTVPAPVQYTPPKLEIPIPNVSFSEVVANNDSITIPWIAQYISGIYTFLLSIVGVVAAAMMIIGGFQYLISVGDTAKISAAKERVTDALIGLVLAFGSYIMLYTINPDLVAFKGLQLTTVQTLKFDGGADDKTTVTTGTSDNSVPSATSGHVPYLAQWDTRWQQDLGCGTKNVWNSGCGPTSLAMVLNSYGISTDPLILEKAARDKQFKTCGSGMNQGAILTGGVIDQYAFVGESIQPTAKAKIIRLLQDGHPLIAGVGGPSIFTIRGHYIVLTGIDSAGNISVNDPGRNPALPYDQLWLANGGKGPVFSPSIPQTSVPQDMIFQSLLHVTYVHPQGTSSLEPSELGRRLASTETSLACMAS